MARSIHINEAKLSEEFEDLLDEMYLTYHVHPTNIPHYYISPEERSEMSYYDALGRALGAGLGSGKSKKVDHHSDPNYCNGLPRRR